MALKKTSNELLAINSTIKAVSANPSDVKKFYTILMALVDYKGFRIVAHADLGPSTQIVSIHNLSPERLQIDESTCNLVQPIGNALNLTSHTVQVNDDRRVRIPMAATVEVSYNVKKQTKSNIDWVDSFGYKKQSKLLDLSPRYIPNGSFCIRSIKFEIYST